MIFLDKFLAISVYALSSINTQAGFVCVCGSRKYSRAVQKIDERSAKMEHIFMPRRVDLARLCERTLSRLRGDEDNAPVGVLGIV